jgi:hypothetical protein
MELMETLRAGLPPGTLLTEPAAMAPYLLDWRKLYQGRALCVARPRDTAEVARIVAAPRQPASPSSAGWEYGSHRWQRSAEAGDSIPPSRAAG